MSKDSRSTQFRKFAELLWHDLLCLNSSYYIDVALPFDGEPDATPLAQTQEHGHYIARLAERAYDFKQYVLAHVNEYDPEESSIPDMTAWPEQEKEVAPIAANAWQFLETEMGEPMATCLRQHITETCHKTPSELATWEIGVSLTDDLDFKVFGERYHATFKLRFTDDTIVQGMMKKVNDVWSLHDLLMSRHGC